MWGDLDPDGAGPVLAFLGAPGPLSAVQGAAEEGSSNTPCDWVIL